MNFLFAKLFQEFVKKQRLDAAFQITGYIGLVYFLIGFDLYLIVTTLFGLILPTGISLFWLLVFSMTGAHFGYVRNEKIVALESRFQSSKINKLLLYLIAVLLPVVLFMTGPTLLILLKGGSILNYHITGLLKA